MAAPRIGVLGVYKLDVTEDLFREQFDILYGYTMSDEERMEAEEQCREQLSSIVMIEALIENRDERFSVLDFTQPQDGVPRDNWQVAYAEAFLALDGNSLLVEGWTEPPETGDFRVAFFMHFWDETKPLLTSYGELPCPSVSEMPERLKRRSHINLWIRAGLTRGLRPEVETLALKARSIRHGLAAWR